MNWFQKMFQSNFLRKLGQGIPVCLLSHSEVMIQPAEGKKKNPIFALTNTTFHFTIYSPSNKTLQ